jgi:hypothetical protein
MTMPKFDPYRYDSGKAFQHESEGGGDGYESGERTYDPQVYRRAREADLESRRRARRMKHERWGRAFGHLLRGMGHLLQRLNIAILHFFIFDYGE